MIFPKNSENGSLVVRPWTKIKNHEVHGRIMTVGRSAIASFVSDLQVCPPQSSQDNKSPKYTVIRVKTQEINDFQINVHNNKDHSACYPLTPTLSGCIQLN